MAEKFLALIFTVVVALILFFVLKRWKGITLRSGIAGIVLIVMPQFLEVFRNPGGKMYSIPVAVAVVIGILLLMKDCPSGRRPEA